MNSDDAPKLDEPQSSTSVYDYNLLKDDVGKNLNSIKCPRCDSIILQTGKGIWTEKTVELPKATLPKAGDSDKELHKYFWRVGDKFDFENCGFTNQLGDLKYLTCADCEIGPVGYFEIASGTSYLAVDLVRYH